jgi:hypothetical protein
LVVGRTGSASELRKADDATAVCRVGSGRSRGRLDRRTRWRHGVGKNNVQERTDPRWAPAWIRGEVASLLLPPELLPPPRPRLVPARARALLHLHARRHDRTRWEVLQSPSRARGSRGRRHGLPGPDVYMDSLCPLIDRPGPRLTACELGRLASCKAWPGWVLGKKEEESTVHAP